MTTKLNEASREVGSNRKLRLICKWSALPQWSEMRRLGYGAGILGNKSRARFNLVLGLMEGRADETNNWATVAIVIIES